MKKSICCAVLTLVSCAVVAQVLDYPYGEKDKRHPLSISIHPDPNGKFVVKMDFAAHVWHPKTDVPSRVDGAIDPVTNKRIPAHPIIALYPKTGTNPPIPSIMYYWEGYFRLSNGGRVINPPEHWAYVSFPGEIVPNTPSDPTKPLPKSLRYGVDSLKIRYTTGDILRAIDESVYNEPSEGAPEEGGAAPL